MSMLQGLVLVRMLVTLSQMQPDTEPHQEAGGHQLYRDGLT